MLTATLPGEDRITTAHRAFDYAFIVKHAPLIVDSTNATRSIADGREKIVRIGAPN